jgi:hypothetical protein
MILLIRGILLGILPPGCVRLDERELDSCNRETRKQKKSRSRRVGPESYFREAPVGNEETILHGVHLPDIGGRLRIPLVVRRTGAGDVWQGDEMSWRDARTRRLAASGRLDASTFTASFPEPLGVDEPELHGDAGVVDAGVAIGAIKITAQNVLCEHFEAGRLPVVECLVLTHVLGVLDLVSREVEILQHSTVALESMSNEHAALVEYCSQGLYDIFVQLSAVLRLDILILDAELEMLGVRAVLHVRTIVDGCVIDQLQTCVYHRNSADSLRFAVVGLWEHHSFAVECERLSEGHQIVPGLQLFGTAAIFVAVATATTSTATAATATSITTAIIATSATVGLPDARYECGLSVDVHHVLGGNRVDSHLVGCGCAVFRMETICRDFLCREELIGV